MSVTFAQRGRSPLTPTQIQNMLNENSQLLQTIQEYQNKGKANECYQYQEIVHRNLVYLATVADANQNINALLPPPRGVLIPPVQHNVNNANAPPTQGPVPPMNEMATPQAPPPNNFSPMNNVHRGQPQPIINPQRPPANQGPQQYRQNPAGYPQPGPHQSFGNNQYPGPGPGHVPPQPNNSSVQAPPGGAQAGPYQPAPNSYPPSQAPAPYSQPAPNGYCPPVSVSPVTPNYGPPVQSQPNYQNGPAYSPATQQPNYGPGYAQNTYGPGSQNMTQNTQSGGYPGGYPASQNHPPPQSYMPPAQGQPPTTQNHPPPQSYLPPNQAQPPQAYPPQNYPQQGYGPQSYSSVPGQPNVPYQQYQRPPAPQPQPAPQGQPTQYTNYNYPAPT